VRAGMGAHFRMPLRTCATWTEVEATVEAIMGGSAPLYAADAGATLAYDGVDWTKPAVLLIGSEATGISDAARAVATPVSIPMHGPVESLNAAMAGVIILFEAARQRRNYVQAGVDTAESYGVS
jgi:TrmH family RNA methyltransferase